jgi:hypothetical protein
VCVYKLTQTTYTKSSACFYIYFCLGIDPLETEIQNWTPRLCWWSIILSHLLLNLKIIHCIGKSIKRSWLCIANCGLETAKSRHGMLLVSLKRLLESCGAQKCFRCLYSGLDNLGKLENQLGIFLRRWELWRALNCVKGACISFEVTEVVNSNPTMNLVTKSTYFHPIGIYHYISRILSKLIYVK